MRLIRNSSFPLRTLAIFEAAKGILAFLAALGVLSFRHTDLRVAIDIFLRQHRINPQRHHLLIESIAKATSHSVGQIVGFCLAYTLIRLWRDTSVARKTMGRMVCCPVCWTVFAF